nr:TonB-dependent receptor [uncultured Chryseobacterium sp.]
MLKRTVHPFFISAFFFSGVFTYAQNVLGRISNESGKGLPNIEVLIMQKDSTLVKSILTDQTGQFSFTLPPKEYVLRAKQFKNILYNKKFSVSSGNLNLGEITIVSTHHIQEVNIQGKKPVFERKVDRMVFNVENSVYSQGTNLLDVLSNTPLVKADDQSISIIGKGSVQVMMNDRILQISGKDLASYLRTLPSNDISKVEVITSPSAKYDAEGNAGLINIITKSTLKENLSGNLSTSFTKNTKESYYNNLAINYNKKGFNASVKLRHTDYGAKVYENQNAQFFNGNALNNHTDRTDNSKTLGANIDLSYKTSTKNTVGIVYDFGKTRNNYENENLTSYYTKYKLDSVLTTRSMYRNPNRTHTLSIYDDYKFGKSGSKIGFTVNYFNSNPLTTLDFTTRNDMDNNTTTTQNTSDLSYNVFSAQSDLFMPLKKFNFETGIKFTRFNNSSDIKYFNYSDNEFHLDPLRNNQFGLTEKNYAAYISFNKTFGKYYTVKAGLRYEYTDLESLGIDSSYRNQYGKFFPNFNIMYKKENNTFTLNYNKRINRPRLGQLNPFRWYSNPFVYMEGNPYLQPTISHNLEFNYLYKSIFMASLYGSQQNSAYGALIRIQDGIKETKTENVYTIKNLGLNLSFNKDVLPMWNLAVNATGYYSSSSSSYPEIIAFNGLSASYNINNTITVRKKNSWFAYVNFAHTLPGKESNTTSKNFTNLTLGSRFNVFENKLTINIRASDILKGTISKGNLAYENFNQGYNNYYDNQSLSISVSYNFGTNKSAYRNNQFNDQYRAN